MSLQALVWAIDQQDIDPIPKLTLIGMANYAGVDNTCWPSAMTLAKIASCSDRAVRAAIAELELGGWINVERRPPRSSLFTLRVERVPADDKRVRSNPANGAGSKKPLDRINWGTDVEDDAKQPHYARKTATNPISETIAPEIHPANCAGSDPEICAGSQILLTLQTVQGTLQTVQGDPANCAGNPSNEPVKEPSTLLRNGDADEPRSVVALNPDIRKMVWEEGKEIVRRITGKLDTPARKQIGIFLREAKDDCTVVLDVLRTASREGPYDPIPWIVAAIQARTRPERKLSVHEQIRRDGNLPTMLGHWLPKPDRDESDLGKIGSGST